MNLFFHFVLSAIFAAVVSSSEVMSSTPTAPIDLHVCAAGDKAFRGTFTKSEAQYDGVDTYSNGNDKSFFRNNGFWYLGDLSTWPPETHYRCVEVEGCNRGLNVPPVTADGIWSASKLHGKMPLPVITLEKCSDATAAASGTEEL